jgi:fucose 4-O-acetylase-like acetyltransferase
MTPHPRGHFSATGGDAGAPGRELPVDAVRTTAIWAVILGHWGVMAVTQADDSIDGVNALGTLGWLHPLTWAFQVMPLFFFVGGYANAVSWRRHRAAGGDIVAWLARRYRRLLLPASALLATLVAVAAVAMVAGADPDDIGTGTWVATVPLWFLTAYLAVVALVPVSHALHRGFGLLVPVAGALVMVAVDAARLVDEDRWVINVNYLSGWLVIHQLGYAWQDGRLPARPRVGAAVAVAGLVAALMLVVVGPYPVAMVSAPGVDMVNSEPPTVALLALAVAQIGFVLGFRDRLARFVERRRAAVTVARVQDLVLTLFLWHMAAAVIAALALYGTGLVPVVALDSTDWLWLRLPWLAACGVVLAALVAVFGPLEARARRGERGRRADGFAPALGVVVAVLGCLVGLLQVALAGSGSHGPLGLPTAALVAYGVGFALLILADRAMAHPVARSVPASRTDN